MFTQPCFIKKDTQELRDILKDMGLQPHPCIVPKCIDYLFVNRGFYSRNEIGYQEETERAIDCGMNEQLFTSIAALRDDSDKFQWFTDGENWVFCDSKKFGSYWAKNDVTVNLDKVHKATVQELIEHFYKDLQEDKQ